MLTDSAIDAPPVAATGCAATSARSRSTTGSACATESPGRTSRNSLAAEATEPVDPRRSGRSRSDALQCQVAGVAVGGSLIDPEVVHVEHHH